MLNIKRNTVKLFQQKVRTATESSQNFPLKGKVVVDKIYVVRKETGHQRRGAETKQKVVLAIDTTANEEGIKRTYAKHIESASSEELKKIFERHISKEA